MAQNDRQDADERLDRRQEQIIPPDGAEAEEREVRLYDAARADMPPSPAGADVEIGGEAAASRRVAGLPHSLESLPENTVGEPTAGAEPFLGYDGMPTDDLIAWMEERGWKARWQTVAELTEQFRSLGCHILAQGEYDVPYWFQDMASFMRWVMAVPWPEDIDLDKHWQYINRILETCQTERGIETNEHRGLLIVRKEGN